MATINYKGMELEEFKSDKSVVFDKPVGALCWNNNGWQGGICEYVIAFIPRSDSCLAVTDHTTWLHMALLPDHPKPRRATWLEVARWCATGNGLVYDTYRDKIDTGIMFKAFEGAEPIIDEIKVRKWSDTEWHEPTADYLGIDDKDYNFNKKYGEV